MALRQNLNNIDIKLVIKNDVREEVHLLAEKIISLMQQELSGANKYHSLFPQIDKIMNEYSVLEEAVCNVIPEEDEFDNLTKKMSGDLIAAFDQCKDESIDENTIQECLEKIVRVDTKRLVIIYKAIVDLKIPDITQIKNEINAIENKLKLMSAPESKLETEMRSTCIDSCRIINSSIAELQRLIKIKTELFEARKATMASIKQKVYQLVAIVNAKFPSENENNNEKQSLYSEQKTYTPGSFQVPNKKPQQTCKPAPKSCSIQ